MPAISVIIPLFNKAPYVRETLESLRAQTCPAWEAFVVDNGSTDGSIEIVQGFSEPRLRLLRGHGNGPGAARNAGLAQATGDWIQFLDADDLLQPDHLARQLELASENPEADLIVGGWQELTMDSQPQPQRPAACGETTEAVETAAFAHAPWAVHAALVRRSRLTPERRWKEECDRLPSEDTAFWFPVVVDAHIAWSPHAGALYRVSTPTSRNTTSTGAAWLEAIRCCVDSNTAFLRSLGREPTPAQCATVMRVFESHYRRALHAGDEILAARALDQARQWLHRSRGLTPAVLARKWIGIPAFTRLTGSV